MGTRVCFLRAINVGTRRLPMATVRSALEAAGYRGHDLERMLVRLLFCLFADDTGIFSPRGAFQDFVETRTRPDGADLGPMLGALFQTLDTPPDERQSNLDETLAAFPYVNGALFSGPLRTAAFDSAMRDGLLEACALDWGGISPAIFGSLFQGVMDPAERRELGAHYTSETNILKLIGPLFLDGLRAELERAGTNAARLRAFHDRLAAFTLLDPACGCGNFLVVAYRELRRLETETIRRMRGGQRVLDIAALVRIDVDQCYGIEVEDFPAEVARAALWLVDHQMNLETAAAFGEYFTRLPLTSTPNVLHANALTTDWATAWGDDSSPPTSGGSGRQGTSFDVILGNPPFGGHHYQTPEQKRDHKAVLQGVKGAGTLDFVTGWFVKAARYMAEHPQTRTAFVATNSISQGEQVGLLWNELMGEYGCRVHFAHRTFAWDNEASGKAAVHVVIVGFGPQDVSPKRLFDYDTPTSEPHEQEVPNINPYLVAGPDVLVLNRSQPLADVPRMVWGNKPTDGGHFLFADEAERDAFLEREPGAAPWVRPYVSGGDFINGRTRYCLWLPEIGPAELRALPTVRERVEGVRRMRLGSKAAATNRKAETPTLFAQIAQPETDYIAVPEVSSERRRYIPMAFLPPEVIASNKVQMVPAATLWHFGVLTSEMHMAWVRYVAGRLESRLSYSNTIVYNNFPWPEAPTEKQRQSVAAAAEAVLAARQPHLGKGATLADLYDPLAMPPELVRAHRALDRAVDLAYRPQAFTTEANRVAFLFDRYEALANPLAV